MKSSIVSHSILLGALQTNSCGMPRTTFNSCEMRNYSDVYQKYEKLKSPDCFLKERGRKNCAPSDVFW